MNLTVTYPELSSQREKMKVTLSVWTIGSSSLDPREEILGILAGGIDISIGDIQFGPGRLLTYQGEQVILYIKGTRSSRWTLHNEPEASKRFHVADCRALERMRREGRFERYVVTNRMDGLFLVDWFDPDTQERGQTEAALKVCKYCLEMLNWRGYGRAQDRLLFPDGRRQRRKGIWEGFAISEFLMEYATFFRSRPSRRDTTAQPNVYVEDWPRISEQKRREAQWRCQECKVDLSAHPRLLHCHHKSGEVTDNRSSNLKVLCSLCHSAQPGHQHMKVAAADRQIILAARARQGLSQI